MISKKPKLVAHDRCLRGESKIDDFAHNFLQGPYPLLAMDNQ